MTPLSRAFVAAYPPTAVVAAVEERRRGLAPVDGLRWMPTDQWHVTMRFCGRVPDAEGLVEAVARAGAVFPPIPDVRLAGAGAFPKARHGSALWLGVAPGAAADGLGALATALEAACVQAGLAPDDRVFRPHLTVARASRARDLRSLVAALGDGPPGPPWTVDHVRLVASDTRATGAVHAEVARIPLGG